MRKYVFRTLAFAALFCILLTVSVFAEDAEITGNDVNFRSGPGTDYAIYDCLPKGTVVTVNEDPLYEEIKEFVIHRQKASTSLLQRNFSIGYNRAARMIDALETNGIIGPVNGSKPREVLVKRNDDDMTETGGMY